MSRRWRSSSRAASNCARQNSRAMRLKRQILGEEPVLPCRKPARNQLLACRFQKSTARIDALQRNLDAMLQRFTEKHPDVVSTRRLIKELEEQKQEEIVARRKTALTNPSSSVNTNPVYQQLKVSLSETEARVAALKTRVAEYQVRYDRLKSAIALVPQIEAEFAQLNRDYEINKKNYEQLVQRRESASLGSEMDNAAGVDFRLIDPPRASPKPVAPNRALFLPLTTAPRAGCRSGWSLLRPVSYDRYFLMHALSGKHAACRFWERSPCSLTSR
jgi:polysaccharide chain length determinant protein (PEP-CTERM system associated)